MHNFKELLIWQRSIKLVETIYTISKSFPMAEQFGLRLQIRKAVVSIPSNIAEGSGRQTDRNFIQFLRVALGSLYEVETQLILAENLKFVSINQELKIEIIEIQKMINGFILNLKSKV
ncbi:MAG: four helix bundle protein [Bacteroidia bacterium]|nr:four helix bundle protein [Bacteroidia bacterium]